jgi:hypothetical protein
VWTSPILTEQQKVSLMGLTDGLERFFENTAGITELFGVLSVS